MKLLIQIGQLLLSLSLLIILHEMGHFLFARLFKARVEKFYLFFNPWFSLFKIKKGETEYGIGWLPFGGYVKISGMIDESMDKEQLNQPPQPYEFRSKPAWQRLFIMLGGVTVNLFLGFLIYTFILFIWGDKYLPNKNLTDGIWVKDSLMYRAGLRTGDKIISVNGYKPLDFSKILEEISLAGGDKVIVNRHGVDTVINWPTDFIGQWADYSMRHRGSPVYPLSPRIPFIIGGVPDSSCNAKSGLQPKDRVIGLDGQPIKYMDQFAPIARKIKGKNVPITVDRDGMKKKLQVHINDAGMLEVFTYPLLDYDQLEKLGCYKLSVHTYTFFQAIPAGFKKAVSKFVSYLRQLKLIFDFNTGAYKAVGGIGTIKNLFPPVWDWEIFWEITAFLSIMLAILNLLPIPALDGGHVAFISFEMITGRKPGEKFLEYAQIAGMIIILFLVLYANGNDFYRWISHLIAK